MDNKDDLDMCSKDKGLRCAPGVFAAMIGVTVKTLQRWDRNGKLPAGHYPSGRRFYTAEHYAACGGDPGLFAGKAQEGAGAMHKDFVSKFFRGLRPVGNILLAMLIPAVQFVLLESFLWCYSASCRCPDRHECRLPGHNAVWEPACGHRARQPCAAARYMPPGDPYGPRKICGRGSWRPARAPS